MRPNLGAESSLVLRENSRWSSFRGLRQRARRNSEHYLYLNKGTHNLEVPAVKVGFDTTVVILEANRGAHLNYNYSLRRNQLHVVAQVAGSKNPLTLRTEKASKHTLLNK